MQDLKRLREDLGAALTQEAKAGEEDVALAMRALLAVLEELDGMRRDIRSLLGGSKDVKD